MRIAALLVRAGLLLLFQTYRLALSRLVPGFSVRTWEIQQEKSHKNEKVTVLTT